MKKYNYSVISSELFDINYSNPKARIAIIGISPGSSQSSEYKRTDTVKENNRRCAFSNGITKKGQEKKSGMRTNLIKILNLIGVNNFLNINSCETLWKEDYQKSLFTSILPYSVVRTKSEIDNEIKEEEYLEAKKEEYKKNNNNRIDGFFISKISYEEIVNNENKKIKENFESFKEVINEARDSLEIMIALGPTYDLLVKAIDAGEIHVNKKIIVHVPHPSNASAGAIKAFIAASEGKTLKKDATTQAKNGFELYTTAMEQMNKAKAFLK